jgi:hypothetical protein
VTGCLVFVGLDFGIVAHGNRLTRPPRSRSLACFAIPAHHQSPLTNYCSPLAVAGVAGAIGVVPLARPAKDDQNAAEENQHRSDHPNQVQVNFSKEECGEEYNEKRVTDFQESGHRSVLLIDR